MARTLDGLEENVVWCFWFGGKTTIQRAECFKDLKQKHENVVLVTENNLKDFEIKGHRIHQGFEFLSSTHKSDYLRSYFMNFYGGGYSDIKKQSSSWSESFMKLKDGRFIGTGYSETSPSDIAKTAETLPFLQDYHSFIGCGAFIFKKRTNFTEEWFNKTQALMDENLETLKKNDGLYHPRATINGAHQTNFPPRGYPFGWISLMGEVYHPLTYKYRDQIRKDLPRPIMRGYR